MVKKTILFVLNTMKWLFIAFLIFVGTLFFREQNIPRWMILFVIERYSPPDMLIRCEGSSFGFRHGISFSGVQVFDLSGCHESNKPMVSLNELCFNPLSRHLRIDGLSYLRLPESYYDASVPAQERNSRIEFTLPRFHSFHVELNQPNILGIAPARVTATADSDGVALKMKDIYVEWLGDDASAHDRNEQTVEGTLELNIAKQRFHSEITGHAIEPQIRPLLVSLDLPTVYPYFDAFTGVAEPVPASAVFDVNLINNDFRMKLDLKPMMGCYKGIRLDSRAEGSLDLYVYTRGTNINARLAVDLPVANGPDGRSLNGNLVVDMTNEVVSLEYDVNSVLPVEEALRIAEEILEPEDILLVAETMPHITVNGVSGTDVSHKDKNSLAITGRVERASLSKLQLNDVFADIRLNQDRIDFVDASAVGNDGGKYTIAGFLRIPDFEPDAAVFSNRVEIINGTINELSGIFIGDLGDRDGRINGWMESFGSANTNLFVKSLNGHGALKIKDGYITQMKVFAGLTETLAKNVPGVDFVVTRSEASADFTIENGVFKSENIYIEGGLFSIKLFGEYDIAADNLDFTARVQFMKSDSFAGKIIHPITWPFTKLLLEFKVNGAIDDPQWQYLSIIDRIL